MYRLFCLACAFLASAGAASYFLDLDSLSNGVDGASFRNSGESNRGPFTIDGFLAPFGITLRPNGGVVISDFAAGTLKFYRQDFSLEKVVEPGESVLEHPHSVVYGGDGSLLVTDSARSTVHKFSESGKFIETFVGPSSLVTPATSHLDSEGNLLVADYGANALLKFDRNGAFIGGIGVGESGSRVDGWDPHVRFRTASKLPGGFDRLHMVATDKAGNIYVADTWNHRVQKFDQNGQLLGWLGAGETGKPVGEWTRLGGAAASELPGGFTAPISLQVIDDQDLYVLDYKGGRLQNFSLGGEFRSQVILPVARAYDFKVDQDWIYVTDTDKRKVLVYPR